jgi:splicing factor 3B subunit 3
MFRVFFDEKSQYEKEGTFGSATAAHPNMHLYNLTLKKASAVTACVYGQFSDAGVQEVVVSRGKILELLRQDEQHRLVSVTSIEVFGYIRKLVTSRLPGANKDHVVVSSDSGKVSVLEFNKAQGKFVVLQCETFGKTGIRRITPGEYLAADIKGRAIMVGAVEKQKFVYVFNRDAAARLTISSPLEAHRSQTINFDIVAVDVGFDNPQFACLEVDYTPVDEDPVGEVVVGLPKTLAFYELDLGLNHVVRKSSEEVSSTANMLITVPGGDAGPSGVLVCAENKIS